MDQTNETPTIRNLSSRDANKYARAAFNQSALLIAELPDGRFALCDRGQTFYLIVNSPPTKEEFKLYNRLLQTSRMAASGAFFGEPDDKSLARDIRLVNQPPTIRRQPTQIPTLDIELKI
jgi:hypothetical protein